MSNINMGLDSEIKGKKEKKQMTPAAKRLIVIITVLVIVAALVVGSMYSKYRAGMKAYEAGEYKAAVDILENTPFGTVDAIKARCRLAQLQLDSGSAEEAQETLWYGGDYETIRKAAEECAQSGDTDTALICASMLDNEARKELLAQLSQIMPVEEAPGMMRPYCLAMDWLDRHSMELAVYHLRDSGNYRDAQMCLDVIDHMLNGRYWAAAQIIKEIPSDSNPYLTAEDWAEIMDWYINYAKQGLEFSRFLAGKAAVRSLREQTPYDPSVFQSVFDSYGYSMIGQLPYRDEQFSINSLEYIYDICGSDPKGKILILLECADYGQEDATYAVSYDLMQHLPAEYLPKNAHEVSYVITVSYSYLEYGAYDNGTAALMEYGMVYAYSLETGEDIFYSDLITGDEAPDSFTHYGSSAPDYKSGGAPDLTEEFLKALEEVMAYS